MNRQAVMRILYYSRNESPQRIREETEGSPPTDAQFTTTTDLLQAKYKGVLSFWFDRPDVSHLAVAGVCWNLLENICPMTNDIIRGMTLRSGKTQTHWGNDPYI
jgi:hypothetical protein